MLNKFFEPITIDLYKELYKDLPEDTVTQKINKIRKMHNLERDEFAKIIGHHWSTIQSWEIDNVPPNPHSIRDICSKFNLSLKYFGEYYYLYFNNPGAIFKNWKEQKGYSYPQCAKLLSISDSGLKRFTRGSLNLSYSLYLNLKNIGVF